MALSPKLTTREFDKFREASGYPAVAVVNPDGSGIASATLYAVVNTGAAGVQNSMVTLFSGPNQIGSVTISNTPNVVVTSLPTVSIGNTINALLGGNVTLNPSPNFIGLATIIPGANITLNASSAFIGLATTVNGAGNQFIGLATVVLSRSPILGAGDTTALFASTATGSMLNTSLMGRTGNVAGVEASGRLLSSVTLNPSPNFIGLATVVAGSAFPVTQSGTWDEVGINDSGNSITVDWTSGATVAVSNLPALVASSAFIGLATVVQGNQPALVASSAFIGLATTVNAASSAYIGLATVIQSFGPPTSNYTSFATVISAAASPTIFMPASGQRWVVKDLMIGTQGSVVVSVLSGAITKIPAMSLATQSGYIHNFGDTGLRAAGIDQSFGIQLGSAVTVSVFANVRFE